jgi:hypothetical protein
VPADTEGCAVYCVSAVHCQLIHTEGCSAVCSVGVYCQYIVTRLAYVCPVDSRAVLFLLECHCILCCCFGAGTVGLRTLTVEERPVMSVRRSPAG